MPDRPAHTPRPPREPRDRPAPAPHRPSPRRTRTRGKVFDAAVELIAEQGYSGTSVEDIAERAGVAKGTIFYNFGSKEELFSQLLEFGIHRLAERLTAKVEGLHGARAVEALADGILEVVEPPPAFIQVVVAELYRTGRSWQDTLELVREEAARVIREVIEEGQDHGELDPLIDARLAAGALMGAAFAVGLDWRAFSPERPRHQVCEELIRMLRGRLSPPPGDG
jgi:AcrR family transcriptional regulator